MKASSWQRLRLRMLFYSWRLPSWLRDPVYRIRRWLEGARAVQTGDTEGAIVEPGLAIEWAGMCPVQGDGTVDGYPCYYRSRGEGWQFHVATTQDGDPLDDDAFEYRERPYVFPDGGYVAAHVSEACIRKGVEMWRRAKGGAA